MKTKNYLNKTIDFYYSLSFLVGVENQDFLAESKFGRPLENSLKYETTFKRIHNNGLLSLSNIQAESPLSLWV